MSDMYKTGEIFRVMDSFEKSLSMSGTVYTGGSRDRAEMIEVESGDGRIGKRFRGNNYYNHGFTNQLFLLFLQGYAAGKCEWMCR